MVQRSAGYACFLALLEPLAKSSRDIAKMYQYRITAIMLCYVQEYPVDVETEDTPEV